MSNTQQNVEVEDFERGVHSMELVEILTTFILMVSMVLVVNRLNYLDVLVLNLLQGDDIFLVLGDYRESYINMIFGALYSIVACGLSLPFAIPCVSVVVLLWISTYRSFGYPHFTWIFFPCLLMWTISFMTPYASDLFVMYGSGKTVYNFLKLQGKSSEDIILIVSFVCIHITFVAKSFTVIYLFLCYLLSFTWMFFKSHGF